MINSYDIAILSEKVAHLEGAVEESTSASGISYDNTDSGLTADDVQGAIDEVSGSVDNIEDSISDMNTWESITLPAPTVSEDSKTRTYAVDLSAYKYLRITVGHASTGGIFATDFNCVGDTIRKYYQVSGQVESYAIVTTTSSLLIFTETQSTHEVAIKSLLALK